MRKFGLIGYPLGHSFSKKYFTEKFLKEHVQDCLYENYPLSNIDQLKNLISEEPDLCGFNVTIPYKSAIISMLDSISPEAGEIGAVNVVKIKRVEGLVKLHGFNSDITGIRESLMSFSPNEINSAIVLGSGGSSRAVCFVLKNLGIKTTIVSRSRKTGTIRYDELSAELISKAGLIINTTPLGMFPDVDSKPDINYKILSKNHILFDLVYNPEMTLFLRMGAEQGCTVINGIKMLHSQAEKAWEIWNNANL
jgi:shikimate dehydrogenase